MRTKGGFTLIEIMVSVAIIGIISAIVIASTTASRAKARDVRRVADIKTIQLALGVYLDVNRQYPAALADLVSGGYLKEIPPNPSGLAYGYKRDVGNSKKYCLGVILETTPPVDSDSENCDLAPASPAGTSDSYFKLSR